MAVTEVFARRATLPRSVRLLSSFRYEQPDPARFYGPLAVDTVDMVGDLWQGIHGESPAGRSVLDVGGGPGYFASAFTDAGLRYVGVEPDPNEMHAAGPVLARESGTFVRASGMALPFADNSVDICLRRTSPSMYRGHGKWAARCFGSPVQVAWWCCPTRSGSARSAATRRA